MDVINHKTKGAQILLTIAAFVVVVAGMSAAKVILVPFLLAAFIAIISAPPSFWLQRKGLPTWLALLVVILGVLFIGLLTAGLVGSSVKDFSRDLPVYESKLRQQTTLVAAWLEKLGVDISGLAVTEIFDPGAAMKLVATLLNGLGNVLANGFLILMTVIFMLLEASSFPEKLRTVLGGPESSLVRFDNFISNVKHYMAIKTLVSLATGILVAIWLIVIGVDYPLLWGLLAFALNYVPNIGSIIAAVPAVLLAIIQLGFIRAAMAAVGYVVINLLMANVVEPRFMGRGLGLSTLVVFLSLLFWGWVLGPVGMLLSVPLTITAKMALDSRDDTRWMAVLLGPEITSKSNIEATDEPPSESES
ncbi:MAG: AI-2E family transporter [Desulfobacterales bacterium]|nr:AI-2E family transporter [Desulfobacterales bacterium]